ncbi:MAG TPA: hypothetical protein VFQ60_03910 [Patescibacteria group bacterium]|nr:hypothetical protein [Patescibacteria group bacterium]
MQDTEIHPKNTGSRRRWINIQIALAVFLCAGLISMLVLLVQNIRLYHANGFLNPEHRAQELWDLIRSKSPAGIPSADLIQDWMTFDYLNHVFSLPPAYLKSALSIHDARYPNLSSRQYARRAHLDSAAFLQQVKTAIQNELQKRSSL